MKNISIITLTVIINLIMANAQSHEAFQHEFNYDGESIFLDANHPKFL